MVYRTEYMKIWRAKNPDYNKRWRKENPDKIRNYQKDTAYNRQKSKEFRERNPGYRNKYTESAKRYIDNNRDKHYARTAVWRAVKSGKLVKPDKCEKCDLQTVLEGDHADYNKRLEVAWLCKPCHVEVTEERKVSVL